MRPACQSPSKLPAYQQLVRLPTPRLGRSMAAKKDYKGKDDSAKPRSKSSLPRTLGDYLELWKHSDAEIYKESRAKIRAQMDQMQKQRSIGGAEGRERAKTRATADMVARDIRNMYFSFNHFASFFQIEDVHMVFDWWDDIWRLGWLNFQVQTAKAKLWIFAPAGEVSVPSKFVRLVAYKGWSALFCYHVMVAIPVHILRLVLSLAIPTLRR